MFYKRNDKAVVDENKVVYIFKFTLRKDDIIFKVGITKRDNVTVRLGEILVSFFNKHRYIPNTSMRRFSRCKNAEEAEKQILAEFEQVNFINKFNGYTEFIYADEDELVALYDKIVKGK